MPVGSVLSLSVPLYSFEILIAGRLHSLSALSGFEHALLVYPLVGHVSGNCTSLLHRGLRMQSMRQ